MKIPNVIKILGYNISIIKSKNLTYEGENVHGLCTYSKSKICISTSLENQILLEVLMHECVHFIDCLNDGGMTERQVNNIGVGIASFLLNNKKVVLSIYD